MYSVLLKSFAALPFAPLLFGFLIWPWAILPGRYRHTYNVIFHGYVCRFQIIQVLRTETALHASSPPGLGLILFSRCVSQPSCLQECMLFPTFSIDHVGPNSPASVPSDQWGLGVGAVNPKPSTSAVTPGLLGLPSLLLPSAGDPPGFSWILHYMDRAFTPPQRLSSVCIQDCSNALQVWPSYGGMMMASSGLSPVVCYT